jgi:phosphatidylinositol-3-phosphatase
VCEDCGSPLARDQRYCLACGARGGARSEQLEELLRRMRGAGHRADGPAGTADGPSARAAPVSAAPAPAAPTPTAPARTAQTVVTDAHDDAPRGGLRLPPPRASVLLVLAFLGFGILMGKVAGSHVNDSLASVRSPLKVVLPASQPAASSSATGSEASASEASSSETSSEPPSAEAQATPTPATGTATSTTKATTPSSSGSEAGAGGSGSSDGGSGGSKSAAGAPAKKLPPIKHVFVVMLSDEPYASVFGPSSAAAYLSGTLEHKGELLVHYDAVAHEELADEAALISGQGPTAETAANCPAYTQMTPTGIGPDEQVLGSGCIYPASTPTLAGQLVAKHLSWRAYVQGIDEAGATQSACAHPVLGQADPTAEQAASSGAYATFRNPFVYFDSVLESPECASDDVGLADLKSDLASAKRTPSFSYIVPDRCNDGNPTPCTAGAPSGMVPADTFLRQLVPEIMGSKAYKESGLLVITVDEAPSSGEFADSSSCCGQPLFANAPSKTLTGAPRGGGAVGMLLLSPYVKAGTTSQEPFNHFSLLRTIEDLFALHHLGYAALPAVKSFEPAMFTTGKG